MGQGEACGFSGRLKMAAWGSAPSQEGFVGELRQSERGGGCGGTAGRCLAVFGNGSSGEAGVQAWIWKGTAMIVCVCPVGACDVKGGAVVNLF